MPENQNRLGRIDEQYRKELSQIIGYELKNPNVTGLIFFSLLISDKLLSRMTYWLFPFSKPVVDPCADVFCTKRHRVDINNIWYRYLAMILLFVEDEGKFFIAIEQSNDWKNKWRGI